MPRTELAFPSMTLLPCPVCPVLTFSENMVGSGLLWSCQDVFSALPIPWLAPWDFGVCCRRDWPSAWPSLAAVHSGLGALSTSPPCWARSLPSLPPHAWGKPQFPTNPILLTPSLCACLPHHSRRGSSRGTPPSPMWPQLLVDRILLAAKWLQLHAAGPWSKSQP